MIGFIFTIDYEIYGTGEGSLKELIYDPAAKLIDIFLKHNARFVPFVEVAELELIEVNTADPIIKSVKQQIRDFHNNGFELGLHLHPQWYNGRYENGKWLLDYSEYNLCTLSRERIAQIVDRSINYLRQLLGVADFTPLSFRAGNWLLQPTEMAAEVLAERGIKVDSSVFKGGLQYEHKLDYRAALRNGHYWEFKEDVNIPHPNGNLLELPIYSQMVPIWKMFTAKRIGLQRKAPSSVQTGRKNLNRFLDKLRFLYPLKLDFCRMTADEFSTMIDMVIKEDQESPAVFRPIVAIGHTKDLVDFETVESVLSYLNRADISLTTFSNAYQICTNKLLRR
jgi:hypothetical protein